MDRENEFLFEANRYVSDSLRHSATIIWQYSISIPTLQGGALLLFANTKGKINPVVGWFILAVVFSVSIALSMMMFRLSTERKQTLGRSAWLEKKLTGIFPENPQFFEPPTHGPECLNLLDTRWLAGLLVVESIVGFFAVVVLGFWNLAHNC
ncbi:MAG TPA: hypothetical protein VFC44_26850 [Candidatus Saccharimonadales bacterium]|nr:hypothetical protein [Candidatus Saccharimonadales bacterium]